MSGLANQYLKINFVQGGSISCLAQSAALSKHTADVHGQHVKKVHE